MTTKYNKSEIFKFAWKIFKANKKTVSFSECLKKAWFLGKNNPIALKSIDYEKLVSTNNFWIKNYFSQRLNNNIMLAEELRSDVFLKIVENIDKFDCTKSKLNTWIFNIVKNTLFDHIRKVKRKYVTDEGETGYKNKYQVKHIEDYVNEEGESTFHESGDNNADDNVGVNELKSLIDNTLNGFSDIAQKVCKLQMQGYKITEISNQLNVPENTVKTYEFRFREALKPKLKSYAL